ncbi:MAG: GNAT family protein [Pseudomonadota bacterium]
MSDRLENWTECAEPNLRYVKGRHVIIEPADFTHDAEAVFNAVGGKANADLWRYIPIGPFDDADDMSAVFKRFAEKENWRTHVIRSLSGDVLGMASYMRLRPAAGSIEVGCIVYSKQLQRTPASTEVMYLMASHIFDDLGYRRYEWKCNNANDGSKRAALRLGFVPEGVFRQDMVMKGENRDTAWFSMLDKEWPQAKAAFEAWLAPENFDANGQQRRSLTDIRAAL